MGSIGPHTYINLYIITSWNIPFIVATILLSHINSHIIHLFFIFYFLYSNFSSPYFQKKKKKTLFLSISLHTYYYTSSNISLSFLPLYLSTTSPLYFLPLFYTLTLHFPNQTIFSPHKTVRTLSLSLSRWIFVLS